MSSVRQRIKCFQEALPSFLNENKVHRANAKFGKRPKKSENRSNKPREVLVDFVEDIDPVAPVAPKEAEVVSEPNKEG